VYNIWAEWTVWAWGYANEVHGLRDATLPDGTPAHFPSLALYAHDVGQLWVEQ
jgi:hypothetical protein